MSGSAPLVNEQDTPAVVASQTAVDWAAAISDGIIPDYDSIMLWDFSYPVTRVQGDATINSAGFMVFGTGLLIVTGDLTTSGNRVYWDGIILVGGKINFNASRTYFDGAVISGSNELLPGPAPPAGTIGPQFKTSITTRAR